MDEAILVVGGLNGFIGSNTTEALVQLGHNCVVTRHKDPRVPRFLEQHIGRTVFVEQADSTKLEDLRRLGERYKIEGIVNVGGGFRSDGPTPGLKGYFDMLMATFQVAYDWKVKRVLMSSTGGIYLGHQGIVDEDSLVDLQGPFLGILAYQKAVEVAMGVFAQATGISTVCARLTGMFGPFQDSEQASLVPRVVHAAVSGKPPDLKEVFLSGEDDSIGLIYIKDTARAIALLQGKEKLNHSVYNVGSEGNTPNRELVEAVKKAVPGFEVELPPGKSPFPPLPIMSTKRLQEDTGFEPRFDLQTAIKDYVEWLRAGNPK